VRPVARAAKEHYGFVLLRHAAELLEKRRIRPTVRVAVPLDDGGARHAPDPVQLCPGPHVDELGAGLHQGVRLGRQQSARIGKLHLSGALSSSLPDAIDVGHGRCEL
jgi:hypothetical protein